MEITRSQCEKIDIRGVEGLDPITVMLEDFGPGQGRITIMCWDEVWKSFWGGMGDRKISQFVCSCDHHYLANKLSRIKATVPDNEALRTMARKRIGQRRARGDLDKHTAADLLTQLKDHEIVPNSDITYSLFCDIFDHTDWVFQIPEKSNHEYKYLCRIIDTVKGALKALETEIADNTVQNEELERVWPENEDEEFGIRPQAAKENPSHADNCELMTTGAPVCTCGADQAAVEGLEKALRILRRARKSSPLKLNQFPAA